MLSKKMAEAKEEASKIMKDGRDRAAEAEAKAKKNFDSCVDDVVKAMRAAWARPRRSRQNADFTYAAVKASGRKGKL
jgi:vacuolar-type H+-ATPase subunit H